MTLQDSHTKIQEVDQFLDHSEMANLKSNTPYDIDIIKEDQKQISLKVDDILVAEFTPKPIDFEKQEDFSITTYNLNNLIVGVDFI